MRERETFWKKRERARSKQQESQQYLQADEREKVEEKWILHECEREKKGKG